MRQVCHTNSMENKQTTLIFSDFTRYNHLDVISATLASERDERRAARAARDAGAVYTHWFITER